jgi:hypothetical protein
MCKKAASKYYIRNSENNNKKKGGKHQSVTLQQPDKTRAQFEQQT